MGLLGEFLRYIYLYRFGLHGKITARCAGNRYKEDELSGMGSAWQLRRFGRETSPTAPRTRST